MDTFTSLFHVMEDREGKIAYLLNNAFCPQSIEFKVYPDKTRGREKPQKPTRVDELRELQFLVENSIRGEEEGPSFPKRRIDESNDHSRDFLEGIMLRIEGLLHSSQPNLQKALSIWKMLDKLTQLELRSEKDRFLEANREINDIIYNIAVSTNLTGLYTIDCMQPMQWMLPESYHYFIKQGDQYLKANWNRDSSQWDLRLSPLAISALEHANRNARAAGCDVSNRTPCPLRDPELISPLNGRGGFEILRILLWDKPLLLSELGESVIKLHYHKKIPLFFIAREEIENSELDPIGEYMIGGDASGAELITRQGLLWQNKRNGQCGLKISRMREDAFGDSGIHCHKTAEHFETLLQHERLLLAVDALHLLKEGAL